MRSKTLGCHRVTVKDKSMGTLSIFTFKDRRILERSSIICQDHGRKPGIPGKPQGSIQKVKDIGDSCSGVRFHKKKKHKRTAAEEKCKEDRGAFAASPLHDIHFHNRTIRMVGYVLLKVKICTSHTIAGDYRIT